MSLKSAVGFYRRRFLVRNQKRLVLSVKSFQVFIGGFFVLKK